MEAVAVLQDRRAREARLETAALITLTNRPQPLAPLYLRPHSPSHSTKPVAASQIPHTSQPSPRTQLLKFYTTYIPLYIPVAAR